MNKVGKRVESDIKRFALEEFPNEACGILTKVGKKMVAIKCKNVADTPDNTFVISNDEYRQWVDGLGVYGVWHTHVNDPLPRTPSQTDIGACNRSGVDWIVLDITGDTEQGTSFGEFFFISPKKTVKTPYTERPYIYGVHDCFTLAVDFYKQEFGITISFRATGYPEISEWQRKGYKLLVDNYKSAGFREVVGDRVSDVEYGDIFIIQLSSETPDHVAIYIGDDRILHHYEGRLSCVDLYGGSFWQKHTQLQLRHLDK